MLQELTYYVLLGENPSSCIPDFLKLLPPELSLEQVKNLAIELCYAASDNLYGPTQLYEFLKRQKTWDVFQKSNPELCDFFAFKILKKPRPRNFDPDIFVHPLEHAHLLKRLDTSLAARWIPIVLPKEPRLGSAVLKMLWDEDKKTLKKPPLGSPAIS